MVNNEVLNCCNVCLGKTQELTYGILSLSPTFLNAITQTKLMHAGDSLDLADESNDRISRDDC